MQAHEEGRVVFFCGAGISYPAGLPGFEGLVKEIYRLNGTSMTEIEKAAFERGQYDATLDLFERRLVGQRLAVRSKLAQALKPNLRLKGAIDTQMALLRLARNREGVMRLVTTNFDNTFNKAAKRIQQPFQTYAAPMLPIPKNSRWNGLVYLHGLLPEKPDDTALNRLVVTSGDFGLAYLTERWAARFVSELFRNYVVCFVGYSINDPVLRYMMDALAADRMLGEVTPQAWALGDCEIGQEHQKTIEWEAKGVKPILYNVPTGSYNHSALHHTLHSWADTYRDGIQGKESIIVKHALSQPQVSTQQDDFVGRMLWALSDKSGLPAKRFADFNPTPSLDWLLEAFSEERFQLVDLVRFGVAPYDHSDTKISFSLIRRPAPYGLAAFMQLTTDEGSSSDWDNVMFHLARWLTRHLNDPRLILWIVQRSSRIHNSWQRLIELELDHFALLKRQEKTSELEDIHVKAPMAIPSPLMLRLWRLLLSGRIKLSRHNFSLYDWNKRLNREGLSTTLRFDLRELLAPKVAIKKPFRWFSEANNQEPARLKQLVDWEIVLATDHASSTLLDKKNEYFLSVMPLLVEDFQQLLRDALDLQCELNESDGYKDRSYLDLPSITPHSQNRGFRDWVILIELLRDAWLGVQINDSGRATRIAEDWFELPYVTFKRLALFAASQNGCILSGLWVDWLLSEDSRWLWSIDTRREVFRLFVLQGSQLTSVEQERLEVAILEGPPREMYRDTVSTDEFKGLMTRSIWLYLAKLEASGCMLGKASTKRLLKISNAFPQWQLAPNERDEFSTWMSSTGDSDYEGSRDVDIAPHKRQELLQWLAKPISKWRSADENIWWEVCRRHSLNSLYALNDLAESGKWPIERWRVAFQAWSEKGIVKRSWRYAARLVCTLPDSVLQEIGHSITWWMEAVSKSIKQDEDILLDLCRRMLLPLNEEEPDNELIDGAVSDAINHPIGHVTQVLINLWFKKNPNDNDLLPPEMESMFNTLCDVQVDRFRHGRVILGSRLIAFYRVDRPWTERYLLPLFSWSNPDDAKSVWEGFLLSPRLYQPVLIAFKSQFLETAKHYAELVEHHQQFAGFLIYVALDPEVDYSVEELRSAFGALPPEGIEESAQALYQVLESAAEQREDYWRNRVQPFWQQVWPKFDDLATPQIAEHLTRLAIAARDEFPAALAAVKDWLKPLEHPDYAIHLLADSGLCKKFPIEVLSLLNKIIEDQLWLPNELGQCLDDIVQTDDGLYLNREYKRLRACLRGQGR